MIKDIYFWDYFNNLLEGNKQKCREIVLELYNDGTDIKELYTDLMQKAMYRVGKLWEEGRLTISEEHLATKVTEYLVDSTLDIVSAPEKNGKTAVITCIDKEFHDLGARIVTNMFELNGWDTAFLGSNTPSREIIRVIEQKKPDMLGISYSLYLNHLRFLELMGLISKKFPDLKILIGGQGLNNSDPAVLESYPNAVYITSLYQLDGIIKNSSK